MLLQSFQAALPAAKLRLMLRKLLPLGALLILAASGPASAKVYPVGLTLKDARVAAVGFASSQPVPGTALAAATSTCSTVSWMAARCVWTEVITPTVSGGVNSCSGTVSVVRQQVKGYPLKLTKVSGTKVVCRKVTLG